ncbi:YopX family protein [Ignatzschineria rhizosphaerae]|uniref:YopX family protein n=1 Tax=Ignatzschineria rhizosphaerae TaxID=2923279 RepID=A0ABY3WZ66_9GAMM|nr:YopX family protein [Ignatzschineria rhizosphaerae]UNM95906.1 YopX family protein [Ignatzschineria rhizosphaerae]
MSRLIKFRAWDIKYKQMILPRENSYYQHFISFCGNVFLRTSESMMCFGGGDQLHWEMNEKIVMLGVDLNDKNGKDCFYDDIVKIKLGGEHYNFIVSKVDGNTVLLDPRNHNAIYGFLAVYKDEFEVIGNLHENPELLED